MIVNWWIETGFYGDTHQGEFNIPEEDIDGMTEADIEELIEDYMSVEVGNRIQYGWEIEHG